MNDSQAPFLYLAFRQAHILNLRAEAKILLSTLLGSVSQFNARVATPSLAGEDVLDFLLARMMGNPGKQSLFAVPTEALAVILYWAARFGLDDFVDPKLSALDHVSLFAYQVDELSTLGDEVIESGENSVWQIGRMFSGLRSFSNHSTE